MAILFREPDASVYDRALAQVQERLLSAVTRVELSLVIEGRKGEAGRRDLEALLDRGEFDVVSVTQKQVEFAIEAFRRFGKGRHPAALNIGDCFSYALARATSQSLLFKGADFSRTDISSALAS